MPLGRSHRLDEACYHVQDALDGTSREHPGAGGKAAYALHLRLAGVFPLAAVLYAGVGLFEEPLYPFLLMNLAFNDIVIPGGSGDDGEEDRVISAFTAFGQIDHKADLKTGQVTLGSAPLTVKVMQRVKADLAGLATADIAENEPIGTIRFTPVS